MTGLLLSLLQAGDSPTVWEQLAEFFSQPISEWLTWQFWLVLAALLLVAEMITSGFVVAAFVPGCLAAAVLSAFGVGMAVQLVVLAVVTVLTLVFLRPLALKRLHSEGTPTNVEALVGQVAVVTEPIPAAGVGRVKVGSEEWRATAAQAFTAGARVRVVEVTGNTVRVTGDVA